MVGNCDNIWSTPWPKKTDIHCHVMIDKHPSSRDDCDSPQESCQTSDPKDSVRTTQHYQQSIRHLSLVVVGCELSLS